MIKRDGDYLIIEGNEEKKMEDPPKKQSAEEKNQVHEDVGDVKAYLKIVAGKIAEIKEAKLKNHKKKNTEGIFDKISSPPSDESLKEKKIQLSIRIPDEIYKLDERLRKIESKINADEIFKQKIQRKGTLTQRVKALHIKAEKLNQKSPEIIYNNIQNYCMGLDEKQLNMKLLYLYDSFTKTQGINDEIDVLQVYLQNLNKIQTKIKGMNSPDSMVNDHEGLTKKRAQLSAKIHKLFAYMVSEYNKIAKEIDQL